MTRHEPALIACLRKFAIILNSMLKNGTPGEAHVHKASRLYAIE
jgi:hypothetical protein